MADIGIVLRSAVNDIIDIRDTASWDDVSYLKQAEMLAAGDVESPGESELIVVSSSTTPMVREDPHTHKA